MENYLDFRQIFGILSKHLLFIIISIIVCVLVALGIERFVMTPQYTSTTQILVNQKKDSSLPGAAYQDQQADVQMISTYKDIITNQVVLRQARQALANPIKVVRPARKAKYHTTTNGHKHLVRAPRPAIVKSTGTPYDVSIKYLQNVISISNQQNSQVFALNVESDDPDKSAAVANEVANVFKQKIKTIMNINNVTIISHAVPNYQKSSPKTLNVLIIGILAGILLGLGYTFIKELTDTTIKDDDYLTNNLNLINLGHVAEIRKIQGSYLVNKKSDSHLRNHHHRV